MMTSNVSMQARVARRARRRLVVVGVAFAAGLIPLLADAGIPTFDGPSNASAFARMAAEWTVTFGKLQAWRRNLESKLGASYQALDEAERLRVGVENLNLGQLSGFGQEIADLSDFDNQIDSLSGEWQAGAKKLAGKFLIK